MKSSSASERVPASEPPNFELAAVLRLEGLETAESPLDTDSERNSRRSRRELMTVMTDSTNLWKMWSHR